VVLIAALLLSTLFSAAETALTSINRAKLRQRLDEGDRLAKLIHRLIQQPRRLLSTVLLGNTLSIVALVVVGTSLALRWLPDTAWALFVAFLGLSLLVLVVGEIIPKSVAASRPDTVSRWVARPVRLLMIALRPLVGGLLALTTPVIRLLGAQEATAAPGYTEEELRTLIEIGQEQGVIEQEETLLLTSALAFDDTPVSAVLTPRVDIVALSQDIGMEEAIALIVSEAYTRMPVFGDSIDNILGIVNARDILLTAARGEPWDLRRIMHSAYHVPENKRLDEFLREMQQQELQIAIVTDEYGGTAGLVTVEDVLEQIVGEIRDETDEEVPWIRQLSPGVALVDTMINLDELNQSLGLELPTEGVQTLGGLVVNRLGRVAKVGDVVRLSEVTLIVKATRGVRVTQVMLEYPVDAAIVGETA
jgi:CBS domain containing-hemolysin-like protein